MKNKLRSTAGGGGGIKQNTLRQGFCLLSFNFNCLFSFEPRVFQLLSATPVNITQFDTLTWIIHVLVISVLLSKTTLPLIPLGINPTQYDRLNPPETLPRPPATPTQCLLFLSPDPSLLLCALLIGHFRKC